MNEMTAEQLREFAHREWKEVEDSKAEYWAKRKLGMTPEEALCAGDALRIHARSVRPDWPSENDRTEDLETHTRVSSSLSRASARLLVDVLAALASAMTQQRCRWYLFGAQAVTIWAGPA